MSHDAHTPAAGGGDTANVVKAVNDLISPRENVTSKTVIGNVAKATADTWNGLKSVVAAAFDFIPATVEASIALPNNLVGLATKNIDKMIVQPIDHVRSGIYNVLTKPSSLFEAGSSNGGGHGHGH